VETAYIRHWHPPHFSLFVQAPEGAIESVKARDVLAPQRRKLFGECKIEGVSNALEKRACDSSVSYGGGGSGGRGSVLFEPACWLCWSL
jgi:hypothetical protein